MSERVAADADTALQTEAIAPALLQALAAVDTPTVCNALGIARARRSNQGFTRGTFICAHPGMKAIVGFARTATLRTALPYEDAPELIAARRMAFYEHVAARGAPTICLMQDIDDAPGTGAFWGEVNSHILRGLGVKGVVTNGALRDLGAIADGFQILASTLSPGSGFPQVTTVGQPVSICGLSVQDGDLIHADCHGAVVIEREVLQSLEKAIRLTQARERVVIESACEPGFSIERLKLAMREAEAFR
jgi:regulator of RNase E activity RraA